MVHKLLCSRCLAYLLFHIFQKAKAKYFFVSFVLVVIANSTTSSQSKVVHTTSTTNAPLSIIFITPTPYPCCSTGYKAGRKGYLCIAYRNFKEIRYHLLHPYKMKFDQFRRKHVEEDLATEIEKCASNPARKRVYEHCCEKEQQKLDAKENRNKKLVKECLDRGGKDCFQFHG